MKYTNYFKKHSTYETFNDEMFQEGQQSGSGYLAYCLDEDVCHTNQKPLTYYSFDYDTKPVIDKMLQNTPQTSKDLFSKMSLNGTESVLTSYIKEQITKLKTKQSDVIELPIFGRADLISGLKIDGKEIDLSNKVRTPFKFTSDNIMDKLDEFVYYFTKDSTLLNYMITIPIEQSNPYKQGKVEIAFNTNVKDVSFLMSYSLFTTSLSKELLDEIISYKHFDMLYMFCPSLSKEFLETLDVSQYTDLNGICYPNMNTSLDLKSWNTSNVTHMFGMFSGCYSLESLNLSSFDTSNVTNMSNMFDSCYSLTSLDLSSFDTSNVTDMSSMFDECDSLTSLDLSNFDTSKVTNMTYMFNGCNSLKSLDLSSFDTSNVTSMYGMFGYCSGLTSLDLSNFDTSNVTDMNYMFNECDSLIHIKCKQAFKDWCITNQDKISLPQAMREGGDENWEIV